MAATATQLSFEAYRTYDSTAARRLELVDGVLVALTPPLLEHFLIAKFLEAQFDAEIQCRNQAWLCFREAGVRTGVRKSRLTDLCVVTLAQARALQGATAIFETPPLSAVEIVSPDSVQRDYRYKRSEYAALGIPEYWLVDGLSAQVTILTLRDGLYEETRFSGNRGLLSPLFPDLELTADMLLAAGELPADESNRDELR